MPHSDIHIARRLLYLNWLLIGAVGSVLFAAVLFTRFSLEPIAVSIPAAFALLLVFSAQRLTMDNAVEQERFFLYCGAAQAITLTIIAGPLSYVAAAADFPLQDHALLALDHALGFNSRATILFVNEHPALSMALRFGYGMIKWPLLGIPIILSATFRFVRLQQYAIAFSIALIVTIVISIFVPAIGNYQALGLNPSDVPNVNISAFTAGQRDIPAVRDGSLRLLELFSLAGIVSFPSFHAASAILFAWALAPVRIMGPIALALNALMIASTPVIGGHYFVDVFAGIGVAVASILAAKSLAAAYTRNVVRPVPAPVMIAAE